MIPYTKHEIQIKDLMKIIGALGSDSVTRGYYTEKLEESLKEYTGAKHVVLVNSGSSALQLSMWACEELYGDGFVFTTPNTFVATTHAIAHTASEPIFVDIHPLTFNLDSNNFPNTSQYATPVKGVVATDFAGLPCDWEEIEKKAEGCYFIRDACHSLGSEYLGEKYRKSIDATCFSFHPAKHITSFEGGAILTENDDIAEICNLLKNNGIKKNTRWDYDVILRGHNYHMSDIGAACALSQLERIDENVRRRNEIAMKYKRFFASLSQKDLTLSWSQRNSENINAYHLFVLQINFEHTNKTRQEVMEELWKKGIGTQIHYKPVYKFSEYKYIKTDLPNTEKYFKQCLSIPMYPQMSDYDVEYVANSVIDVVS